MMKMQNKSSLATDKNDRRRGRPAGKNRTPLSLEERRARNALYERERRNETADAMAQLAEATFCDPQIANAELLATVISQLQRRAKRKLPQDIEDLRRVNKSLESQIAAIQNRLGQDVDVSSIDETNNSETEENCETSDANYQTEDAIVRRKSIESQTRHRKGKGGKGESPFQLRKNEAQRSNKIRKTSKSSSVREKIASDSDSSSNSDWSASVKTEPTQYKLRNRSQKVSEQSECTTSSYPYRTSESSSCGTLQSINLESNESNASKHPVEVQNDPVLSVIPESGEFIEHYDNHTETALLETLTEGEKRIINEWLDGSETLNAKPDHVDSQIMNFLDFDDFLLDINA